MTEPLLRVAVAGDDPADRARLERQLGPLPALPPELSPDVTVRYVDELPLSSELTFVGDGEAGFTTEQFVVLRNKHKTTARVHVPLDRLGQPCEITAERRAARITVLEPMLHHAMLGRGVLPVHAAAVRYQGCGILIVGWAEGGKTEALLGFMDRGAEFIGDEWLYLDQGGARMRGKAAPVFVWDWHLRELPRLRARMPARMRRRFGAVGAGVSAVRPFARRPGGLAHRVVKVLERQQNGYLAPQDLFAGQIGALESSVDLLVLVLSHAAPATAVRAVDAGEVAARMRYSLEAERDVLRDAYWRFRFAFPDRACPWFDQAPAREAELLSACFAGKRAVVAAHPYPVAPGELAAAVCAAAGLG